MAITVDIRIRQKEMHACRHGRVEEPLGSCFGIMISERNRHQAEEDFPERASWIKAGLIGIFCRAVRSVDEPEQLAKLEKATSITPPYACRYQRSIRWSLIADCFPPLLLACLLACQNKPILTCHFRRKDNTVGAGRTWWAPWLLDSLIRPRFRDIDPIPRTDSSCRRGGARQI